MAWCLALLLLPVFILGRETKKNSIPVVSAAAVDVQDSAESFLVCAEKEEIMAGLQGLPMPRPSLTMILGYVHEGFLFSFCVPGGPDSKDCIFESSCLIISWLVFLLLRTV